MKRTRFYGIAALVTIAYAIFARWSAGPYHWRTITGPIPFDWFGTAGKINTVLLYLVALGSCLLAWDWLFDRLARLGWHWFSWVLLLLVPFLVHVTARTAYITVVSIWWAIR